MKKHKYILCILITIPLIFYSSTMTQDSWEVFTVDGLANKGAAPILEDSMGNIWFLAGKKGVLKYDENIWTNYSTNQGLVSNEILTIYEDSKGNMWFRSSKGILRYSP